MKTADQRAQERAAEDARWDDEVRPALERIAAAIEPFVGPYHAAFDALGKTDKSGSEELADLAAARKALNDAIEPHVDAVAKLTGNSADTIRMVSAPKDEFDTWFTHSSGDPAEYLRNVARFRSFNTNAWTAGGWLGYGKGIDLPPPQRLARERAEVEALGIDFTKGLHQQAPVARQALEVLAKDRGYGPDDMSGTAVGRYFSRLETAAASQDNSELETSILREGMR